MTLDEAMTMAARGYFADLVLEHEGNIREIARAANLNRTHCYKLMRQLGIRYERAQPLTPITPNRFVTVHHWGNKLLARRRKTAPELKLVNK